jgi:hypothetical protein
MTDPSTDQTAQIRILTVQLSKLTAVHHTVSKESERRRLALHAAADSIEGLKNSSRVVGYGLTDALESIATNARNATWTEPTE